MTLHISNPNVDKLLDEITRITGESRTEAVRKALEERRRRLSGQTTIAEEERRLIAFLQSEVWPRIPPAHLGVQLTKEEQEDILGYGEHGA